jgi:aerobic-type carbon monoxide dehydrogenase small subunit (CoxS/CutS family)
MDQATGGSTRLSEEPEASDRVALEVLNYGRASENHGVTRRRAITGGATALIAASTAAVGLGDASTALASTADKKTKKKAAKKKGPLKIRVNGHVREVTYAPDTMLLYVLRDEFHMRGPKFGCGLSECGACAVLLDGKQIRSCVTPVHSVGTKSITTLDGLAAEYHSEYDAKKGALHPLQQAWIDEQVPQCGYCQAGMIIQAADLLSTNKNPTVQEIKTAMNGHLCRCGTYNSIIRAIQRAAKVMATAKQKEAVAK